MTSHKRLPVKPIEGRRIAEVDCHRRCLILDEYIADAADKVIGCQLFMDGLEVAVSRPNSQLILVNKVISPRQICTDQIVVFIGVYIRIQRLQPDIVVIGISHLGIQAERAARDPVCLYLFKPLGCAGNQGFRTCIVSHILEMGCRII